LIVSARAFCDDCKAALKEAEAIIVDDYTAYWPGSETDTETDTAKDEKNGESSPERN